MALKFSCNLSTLFKEAPTILERYKLAKDAGFKYVESGFPLGFSVEQVAEAKKNAGVQQVLINVYTGDIMKGELGFAAIPGQEEEFKKSINTTVQYAKALDCKLVHVMSGRVASPTEANDTVFEKNLSYAAEQFQKEGIVGLIEPINNYSAPNYYMNNFQKALELIKKINSPSLKIQLDIFHLQTICGNVTRNIKELLPYVGHVQIAQVPDRYEPNTPGEVDYKYVLKLFENEGYDGYIGLEYLPKSSTVEGLTWMKEFNYTL